MLPPQAPPAYVTHANQAAVDALQRLRETQDWLVEQEAALPDLPTAPGTSDRFLDALDAFWDAPVADSPGLPPIPRRLGFARRLAQVAADDAALRHNDGSLAEDDLALVRAFARPTGLRPSHVHARELLVGTRPYAGALILHDDRDARVLLFTVEAGWQRFASLDNLFRDVEPAMRRQLAERGELPGVDTDTIDAVIDTPFLDTRLLDGEVFQTLAVRLGARLRERVALAWATDSAGEGLHDALHPSLDLHALLDVHGIVRHRDLALAAAYDRERLAGQPAAVREHWRRAAADYRDHLDRARDLSPDMASLEMFTWDVLTVALHERGIAVPPHELRVRLSRRTLENGPLATALTGFAYEDLTLPELAYRNLGATDGLAVVHTDGSAREDVPAQVLREVVRDLDLPHAYARYVDDTFGDTPEGRYRRATLTGLLKARLRFHAADARLAYHDPHEPRSFLPAPRERGFAWLEAVLDHPAPAGRAPVEGHEIAVHQLTYRGAPLTGVFVIGTLQPQAVPGIVLYTPDAPDGLPLREFRDFGELTRRFLLDRHFETYLLDRLPAEFGEPDPRGRPGFRRFKTLRLNGDRTLSWIFPFLDTCDTCTELAEDFRQREVGTDFLQLAYDDTIALAKRNANDLARSTAATDAHVAWDVFWNWNLPVQLTRELAGGVVQSVPRTAQAAWRFYDHVKAGQSTEAFLAFVDGYTAGLNVLPLYTHLPALAGAHVRAAGSRALVRSHRNLPAPDTLFPEKYLAGHLDVPAGEPPSGVFHPVEHAGVSRGVIRQDGKLYRVRFDKANECWRLDRPGNPTGYGPAVERATDGRWHYRRAGLRGGNPYEDLFEVQQMLGNDTTLHPSVAILTGAQRVTLVDTLHRSLSFEDFALTLRARIGRLSDHVQLTPPRQQAWNEALRVAQAAPREAPGPAPAQTLRTLEQPSQPGPSRSSDGGAPAMDRVQPAAAAGRNPALPGSSRSGNPSPSVWYRQIRRGQRVPREHWPTHVYAYLPPDGLAQEAGGNGMVLRQLRTVDTISGAPVTTLPPDTPFQRVPWAIRELLPRSGEPAPGTLGEAAGRWVRISLSHLPTLHPGGTTHRYHLYRVPWVRDGYYLRMTELSAGRPGWVFSNEPLRLTPDQYVVGP